MIVHNRFDSSMIYGYGLTRPTPMVLNVVDTTPIDFTPSKDLSYLVTRYRDKGYPLGKSRRGIKKYWKRKFLKALGCKSYNDMMRKKRELLTNPIKSKV